MTPHDVNIVDADRGTLKVIPPSGMTVRLSSTTQTVTEIDGVTITKTTYGDAVGLPERADGVFYVVSQLVKNAFPQRDDLLVPAGMLRDKNGNIVGCTSLGM